MSQHGAYSPTQRIVVDKMPFADQVALLESIERAKRKQWVQQYAVYINERQLYMDETHRDSREFATKASEVRAMIVESLMNGLSNQSDPSNHINWLNAEVQILISTYTKTLRKKEFSLETDDRVSNMVNAFARIQNEVIVGLLQNKSRENKPTAADLEVNRLQEEVRKLTQIVTTMESGRTALGGANNQLAVNAHI